MAFIRRHGKQLALVHGVRDPETKAVEQQILFTFYSKPEVLDALGDGDPTEEGCLQELVERANPNLKFDWEPIKRALRDNLRHLPDRYDYRGVRLEDQFDRSLVAFTRELAMNDPQWLDPSAQLICERADALRFLSELISWRIRVSDVEPSSWNADNRYLWLSGLRGKQVPMDVEELAEGLMKRQEFDLAEAGFRLLIEAFDDYAEGHNYRGLIALERDQLVTAEGHFRTTVVVGRKLFPKRFAKRDYWSDLRTRPYIRGLRNLALTLVRLRRFAEALGVCDTLDAVVGDDITANSHRAACHLCLGNWEESYRAASFGHHIHPSESLVAAFALFESGNRPGAAIHFLHALLNHPHATRIVLGLRIGKPSNYDEAEDHNTGVELLQCLGGYLGERQRVLRRLFEPLLKLPGVRDLENRAAELLRIRQDRTTADEKPRAAFKTLQELQSPEFAASEARRLFETEASIHVG